MQSVLTNEKGIALLLVLWIIVLLSVVCTEFSWTMRTETAITRNYKEGVQAYYAAEAGINRAIIELMRTINNSTRLTKTTDEDSDEPEQDYWEPGLGSYQFNFEESLCEVEVEDEGNRLGINTFLKKAKKNPALLKDMLNRKTELEGEKLDIVADSLIDWWDKDHNMTGLNGAEDDYYNSLEAPYDCRDGVIPVVEELLLIRGISEEIYYGRAGNPEQKIMLSSEELEKIINGKPLEDDFVEDEGDNETEEIKKLNLGLEKIFSANSRSSTFKLNINTATVDQLLMLEGMNIGTAREIVNARKERKFVSSTDRLPQFNHYEVWRQSIKVPRSGTMGYYKIKARGYSPDGLISKNIICDVMLTRNRCVLLSWKTAD